MNKKLKNYIEVLFIDVPKSKKAIELKQELLSNMADRFDDYIAQGESENQAYTLTISNMGDIDELLAEVMPTAEFKKEVNAYRKRNAKNIAIAVSMYIIGVAALIGFSTFGEEIAPQVEQSSAIVGLLVMFVLAAIATGIIIYTSMSTPIEYRDFDSSSKKEAEIYQSNDGSTFKRWMSIYWLVITFVYLFVSFMSMAWHMTWLIWILAAIFEKILGIIFELRTDDE